MKKSIKTRIEPIPHKAQKYNTCGNYWVDEDGTRQIRVSFLDNPDYEFLLAIHEFVEQHFCEKNGIKEKDITKFDLHFEEMREAFPDLVGTMEAGDHENAPYNKEHKLASMFEKWIADNLAKIDDVSPEEYWEDYNNKINNL